MPDWTTAFAPQKFMPALHGALADMTPHFNPVDMTPGKPADAGLAAMGFGQAPPLMQGAASPPAAGGLAGTGGGPMQPTQAMPQAMPQAAPTAPQAPEQRYMMSGPVGDYMRSNQGAMFNLAAGLLGGRQGLQQAVANMPQAMAGDRDKARRAEQNAAIQQWLGSQTDLDPRTAALYRAFPQLAAQQAFAQPDLPNSAAEYEYAKANGFGGSYMDFMQSGGAAGAESFGKTPVYAQDADGNIRVVQIGDRGNAVATDIPDGLTVVDPFDLAAGKAEGRVVGKGRGEAQVNLPQAEYNAQRILYDVDAALNSPGLSKVTGFLEGRIPAAIAGGERREAISRIDKLTANTFVMAFESLKGGGQITEYESKTAAQALSRIQDRTLDDAEYLVALREFRQSILDLLDLARRRAAGQAPPDYGPGGSPEGGNGGGSDPLGLF